jgi:hypothetical protein
MMYNYFLEYRMSDIHNYSFNKLKFDQNIVLLINKKNIYLISNNLVSQLNNLSKFINLNNLHMEANILDIISIKKYYNCKNYFINIAN